MSCVLHSPILRHLTPAKMGVDLLSWVISLPEQTTTRGSHQLSLTVGQPYNIAFELFSRSNMVKYGGVMVNSTPVLLVTVVLSAARHGVAVPLRCLSPSAAQTNRSCPRLSVPWEKRAKFTGYMWQIVVNCGNMRKLCQVFMSKNVDIRCHLMYCNSFCGCFQAPY